MGLYKGSALSLFLFVSILDEVSKDIRDVVHWCILFAANIMIVGEFREEVKVKLDERRIALEGKGLRISRTKTQCLKCNFSGEEQVGDTSDHGR